MKVKFIISLLSIVTLSAPFTTAFAAEQIVSHKQAATTESRKDGAILEWLIVLNKNEIGAANEAVKRKLDPMVEDYARLMLKEHGKNLQETLKVGRAIHIKPISAQSAMELKKQGQQDLAELKPMDDKAFQKKYIDAMVKGHTDALEVIKSDISEVHNAALKTQLKVTEKHVKMHLEKAEAIQEKLGS